jgi:hypothetical protein
MAGYTYQQLQDTLHAGVAPGRQAALSVPVYKPVAPAPRVAAPPAPKTNFLGKALNKAKSFGNAAISGERVVSTAIARELPGGLNDIKAQQNAVARSANTINQAHQDYKAGRISANAFKVLTKTAAGNAAMTDADLHQTISTMPSKGQIAAGAASTLLDILTGGTAKLETTAAKSAVIRGAEKLATKIPGKVALPAGFAASGAANAAAAGGNKKQVIESALAGAALPVGLNLLGRAVSKAKAARLPEAAVPKATDNVIELPATPSQASIAPRSQASAAEAQGGGAVPPEPQPRAPTAPVAPAVNKSEAAIAAPAATPVPKENLNSEALTPSKPVSSAKDYLDTVKQTSRISGNTADDLHRLETESTADKIATTKFLKGTENLNNKDLEAVYHYAEDKTAPLTPAQRQVYETYVKPLQDEAAAVKARLAQKGIPVGETGNYVHRIAQNRGGRLERFLKGDSRNPVSSMLRQTTDSRQGRVMKALEDEKGNRTVVSIKTPRDKVGKASRGGKQVTAFTNGKTTKLGPLRRKTAPAITEFYDQHVMTRLNKVAKDLGISHERTNKSLGQGVAGYSKVGKAEIKTRAATPEQVLLHEIGHQVDEKYGMKDIFLKGGKTAAERKTTNEEMRALADLRHEGIDASNYFKNYVRKGSEKMAVMFEAYLHAPERFKEVAPTVYKQFTDFLDKHEELHGIRDIKPSLVLGSNKIGDEHIPGMFKDKSGNAFRITDATTKEIEQHTNVKYYKNPIVNSTLDLLQSRQAERASQFIDQWKKTPEFSQIAVGEGKAIPSGWKPVDVPQFRGYYFEPKTAEVLNDFAAHMGEDPLAALGAVNRFLRTTIFFNPLLHIPNVAAHWAMNRGAVPFASPAGYIRLARTSGKAINEVVHQGPLYQQMLREGAPMMAFDSNHFTGQIAKMMDKDLQKGGVGTKVADALGYANPKKMLEAWYGVSHKATWYSNDILTMQAIMEEMGKGKSMREAITQVGKHIPDYRLPARIAGSRQLKNLLSNENVSMFTSYHYGILKNYSQTVRSLVAKSVPVAERAGAIDKLMAAGLIGLVLYPAMDHVAKQITGNPNSIFRRAGPFTWPYNVYEAVRGQKTPGQVLTGAVTPAPGTKSVYEIFHNKDTFGNQIYNPADLVKNPAQFFHDVGKYASQQAAPIGQIARANRGSSPDEVRKNRIAVAANLIGISNPKSPTEAKIQRLLTAQLNSPGMTTAQQRANTAKAAARAQLAAGQGDSLAKELVKQGIIAQDKLGDFKKTANLTPTQRAFDALSISNKLDVLNTATPADRQKLGDMHSILVAASETAHNRSAKAQTKADALSLIKKLGGDPGSLYNEYKSQAKANRPHKASSKFTVF